jgi:hypothetical protein
LGFIGALDYRYITEDDLMRFMPEEDAIRALALFDGAMETGKITKKALKSWVVCASASRCYFSLLFFYAAVVYTALGGTNVLLSPVFRMFLSDHMCAPWCTFQECDITVGDIKEVN